MMKPVELDLFNGFCNFSNNWVKYKDWRAIMGMIRALETHTETHTGMKNEGFGGENRIRQETMGETAEPQ